MKVLSILVDDKVLDIFFTRDGAKGVYRAQAGRAILGYVTELGAGWAAVSSQSVDVPNVGGFKTRGDAALYLADCYKAARKRILDK